MSAALTFDRPPALLMDIDGVLHVGDEPVPGAIESLAALRELTSGIRLATNTTSRSRREVAERLQGFGFAVEVDEILTPASAAVTYCQEKHFSQLKLLVGESLREDLGELSDARPGEHIDAIVLGDLGDDFNAPVLNDAFHDLCEGAELVALQHNRFWQDDDGLRLDVGAYAAALEYAAQQDAVVVGKPARDYYLAALAELGAEPATALMVGDDVEADVYGAQAVGIAGVLVRTGKYRPGDISERGYGPSATIDSVAALPDLIKNSVRP